MNVWAMAEEPRKPDAKLSEDKTVRRQSGGYISGCSAESAEPRQPALTGTWAEALSVGRDREAGAG